MKATIIGGGVNGICSAYYLTKKGWEVEIIDPNFSSDGSSYGNAGMVVPSHFIPMASPGVISKGLKWILDSSSPFYIKPRLNLELIQWLWSFYRHSNKSNVLRSQELIWKYNELSKEEYKIIASEVNFDFDFQERGLMMLYKNEKGRKEEVEIGEEAIKLGLKVEFLDQVGVQDKNPDTKVEVMGGVFYPGDAHLYSNHFMISMIAHLKEKGVKFISQKVTGLEVESGKVKRLKLDNKDNIEVEHVVVAAGAWSAKLLKDAGIRLLLQDGKGYSVTAFDTKQRPTIPSILTDDKVAITPMGNDLRITGTLEISGLSAKVNKKRVQGFLSAVPRYFPDIKVDFPEDQKRLWTGYRPLSSDGVPYVGRTKEYENLIVATGQGMMGMSLGPETGKLVAEILNEEVSELNLDLLSPNRN